jgi:hypothetical protein
MEVGSGAWTRGFQTIALCLNALPPTFSYLSSGAATGRGVFRPIRITLMQIRRLALQGHETVQARVFGLVDDAHPAAAQLLDNAVMRDGLTDDSGESYVGETGKSMKAGALAANAGELFCPVNRARGWKHLCPLTVN